MATAKASMFSAGAVETRHGYDLARVSSLPPTILPGAGGEGEGGLGGEAHLRVADQHQHQVLRHPGEELQRASTLFSHCCPRERPGRPRRSEPRGAQAGTLDVESTLEGNRQAITVGTTPSTGSHLYTNDPHPEGKAIVVRKVAPRQAYRSGHAAEVECRVSCTNIGRQTTLSHTHLLAIYTIKEVQKL